MANRLDREEQTKKKLSWRAIKESAQIFRFIKPYRWYFLLGLILLVVSSLIFMIFPGAAGEMANAANGNSRLPYSVGDYGILFLVILVLQGIFSYFRTVTFAIVSERGMADVRTALYQRIITQPISFFEERRIGEITSRITADVEQLQSAFSITLAEFLRQVVILIAGVAILAWLAPKLSLIMLVSFPIIVVLAMVFGRYIRRLSRNRQDKLASANTIVEETLHSVAAVKSFTNEWFETVRYSRSVSEIVAISLRYARVRGVFFIFIITVLFGGIFFVLWQGALFVERGDMQVGDLFSFIIYTGLIGAAIASIGNLYTVLAGAIGATERILEILRMEPELEVRQNAQGPISRIKGDIRFSDVSFRYPTRKDMPVLTDLNFTVEAGQKVALVGASGSGKSTIAKLIMRFYDTDSGRIFIDGRAIKDLPLVDLRQNMATVPQEVILFGGTIEENIRYGKQDATDAEIEAAARKANAWDFIQAFPEGLQTVVGDRGIKLSGGQRQRVAIARAILRDPSVLLLDEATSSLDAEAEKVVQDALDKLMDGRTSIIIAHRLATVRKADCIYVIEGGRIVEQGTHEELSAQADGMYSTLARLQFETTS